MHGNGSYEIVYYYIMKIFVMYLRMYSKTLIKETMGKMLY